MKPFILLFVMLLSGSAYAGTSINELLCQQQISAFSKCGQNADCIIISSPCGWPNDAVNKKFEGDAVKCNQLAGAAIGCLEYNPKRDGVFTAECVAQKCVATKS